MQSAAFGVYGGGTLYGSLHAYDPIPDANGRLNELWNDNGEAWYRYAAFVPPTIGRNNRVYVPTASKMIVVYGPGARDNRPYYSVPGGDIAAFHQDVANKQITAATIGRDGAVHVFWEMNNGPWGQPQQEAIVTAPNVAQPGSAIVSLGESDGRTFDTFFLDYQGAVNWLSVVDGQFWANHGRITSTNFAPPGAKLSAALRGTHAVDVFVIGTDDAIHVLTKNGGSLAFSDQRLGNTLQYSEYAQLAPVELRPGQLSILGIDFHQNLTESDIVQTNAQADTWGTWSAPRIVTPSPLVHFPAWASLAGWRAYAAGIDATGTVQALWFDGSTWRSHALSKDGGAQIGAAVTLAPRAGASTPMVFAVGNEGAMDVYEQLAGFEVWTPHYLAHTQSFGTAPPGARPAVAFQDSTVGADVVDVLVGGRTDVFVQYIGGNAPTWSRPGWGFH
jgi:hypothetical protein